MTKLAVVLFLMVAGSAWGQDVLPLQFKGVCKGTQTDIRDLSAIQDTPATKCDALTIMQKGSETIASFSNGDPTKPVLAFTGELFTVRTNQLSVDPYQGPIGLAFPIDHVLWGDGTPAVSIHPAENVDKMGDRGCYFHFIAQGWAQLTTVECELAVDTPNHRPRRIQVTFRIARQFTVDGKQISVEYGARGANSFHVLFDGLKIDGTCGADLYQAEDGVLRHTQPGTPIARLFKVVCYKDVASSQ
jgi:hypothetical protein